MSFIVFGFREELGSGPACLASNPRPHAYQTGILCPIQQFGILVVWSLTSCRGIYFFSVCVLSHVGCVDGVSSDGITVNGGTGSAGTSRGTANGGTTNGMARTPVKSQPPCNLGAPPLSPLSASLSSILQPTDDQMPFVNLSPAMLSEDYMLGLEDGEGINDLFDSYDLDTLHFDDLLCN